MKYRAHEILIQRTLHGGIPAWQYRVVDEAGSPIDEGWGDAASEEDVARYAQAVVDFAIAKQGAES